MNLYAKVILIVGTTVFISIISIAFVVIWSLENVFKDSIGDAQLEIADEAIDKIDRTLFGFYQDIRLIAENPIIEDLVATKSDVLINDTYVYNEELVSRLEKLHTFTGPWDVLTFVNTDGSVIYSSHNSNDARELQSDNVQYKAFQAALSGEVYYSDAVRSHDTGWPTLFFSAPIYVDVDEASTINGVVIGQVSWPVIQEIMDILPGNAILINEEGRLLYDNSQNHDTDVFLTDIHTAPAVVAGRTRDHMSEVYPSTHDILHGESVPKDVLSSQVTEQGYLRYFGNKWLLILEQPAATAFTPARSMSYFIFSAALLAASLVTIGILVFLRIYILRPLSYLTHTAQQIAAGNTSARVHMDTKDEIGILARVFNTTIENLLATQAVIKDKSIEQKKTQRELEKKIDELERFQKLTVDRELKMIALKQKMKKQQSSDVTDEA